MKQLKFDIKVTIEAVYDEKKTPDEYMAKLTAVALSVDPNFSTIENGVQVKYHEIEIL